MMNEEREALRAENAELRLKCDEYKAKCAELVKENGNLKELVDRYHSSNKVLFAQMEVVNLIFGGRR